MTHHTAMPKSITQKIPLHIVTIPLVCHPPQTKPPRRDEIDTISSCSQKYIFLCLFFVYVCVCV